MSSGHHAGDATGMGAAMTTMSWMTGKVTVIA